MKARTTYLNTLIKRILFLVIIFSSSNISNAQSPGCHPDYDALMALYNSTGGSTWVNNTNWGIDCDICSGWNGITCDGNGRVTDIFLFSNNLEGVIPPEIAGLTELQSLILINNKITSVAPELWDLPNLSNLNMSSNDLAGALPTEIGNLISLQKLSLYGNDLTGQIPAELGLLANLQELSLGVGCSICY